MHDRFSLTKKKKKIWIYSISVFIPTSPEQKTLLKRIYSYE